MPRATSKGDSDNSREMVDRWSLPNGTAVQIHWPSSIEQGEGELLQEWLQLVTKKILAHVQGPVDWREQRDRTKQALADRIVEVPKAPSLWDIVRCSYCGVDMATAYELPMGMYCQDSPSGIHTSEQVHPPQPPPPPAPPTIRRYFVGCQCDKCKANYGVAGTEVVSVGDQDYDAHITALVDAQSRSRVQAPLLYFQGCKCAECKANRGVGALVWGGSVEHATHMANVVATTVEVPDGPAGKAMDDPNEVEF